MELTPLDSPMEVDVMVAGQDAGWVHPGQSALIQFAAFLYTRYGTAAGTVRYQSADSFTTINTPTQVGATLMQAGSPTLPYFDTRITIDQINLHGIPGGFHLRPGMPVQVQIKTGSAHAAAIHPPAGADRAERGHARADVSRPRTLKAGR